MRLLKPLAVTGSVLVAATAGTVWFRRSGEDRPVARASSLPTVTVRRTDLAGHQQFDGTLGYAHSYRVVAPGRGGTLTWVPDLGDVITRGHRAYSVDDHPVPLFYGSVPLWRPLHEGMSNGHDVSEIEHNLAHLGYGSGMTVDDHFTAATAAAVKAWQDDLGVSRTGTVSPGDIVVEPGALRVTQVSGTPSLPARGTLYTASSTRRSVSVDMPVGQQQLARPHAEVQVDLPGGTSGTGHVSHVGTVAHSTGSQDQNTNTAGGGPSQSTQNAVIAVDITLDDPAKAGKLDQAPVTVEFASAVHRNVLAVPVTALLARPDGGYVVEAVDGAGRHRDVPVRLGIFAQSEVEVSGPGVTAGMRVEVPSP